MLWSERQRMPMTKNPRVYENLQRTLAVLTQERDGIEHDLLDAARADPQWSTRLGNLRSISSVGPAIAVTLLADCVNSVSST